MYLKTAILYLALLGLINGENIQKIDPMTFLKPALSPVINGIKSMTMLGIITGGFRHVNMSSECQTSLANLTTGLDNIDMNAIKFLDASGKLQAGIGLGSISSLGSYDQCVDADYPSKMDSQFQGQYCSVTVKSGFNIALLSNTESFKPSGIRNVGFRWDACVPSLCSHDDVKVSIENFFRKNLYLSMANLSVSVGVCQTRKRDDFNTAQIVSIVILSILGALLVSGTILDVSMKLFAAFCENPPDILGEGKGLLVRRILLCFSMYTNGVKILNTNQPADNLSAVNGVRFLSMAWVILGHAYYFINMSLFGNLVSASNIRNSFAFQAIINATVSVDSFFFLSGLLVAYIAIKGLRQNGKINWGLYYFHRVWRLTPAYALVILIGLLFPFFGSGPTWKDPGNTGIFTNCYESWWPALLYISNVYKQQIMCLGHGWYLSNDMQFYILSPIILFALYKKPIVGIIINLAFMLAAIITPIYLGVVNDFPPTTLFFDQTSSEEKFGRFFREIYITPWCRMGPYCVGLYAGYFLAGNKKLNFSRMTKTVLWCMAIACNISVLYGVFEWNKGNPSSTAIHAMYLGTHRTAWAVGLAWVVIACSTGNGGVVNSILSWKLFIPLGRTTYLAYLLHPFIQLVYSGILRERVMFMDYSHVVMYLGFLVISYGFAFAGSLAFEAPFLGLEKILFPKRGKKEPEPPVAVNGHSNGVLNKAFDEKL